MTKVSNNTRKLLAFSKLKGVGPSALRKIASLNNFEQQPIEEIAFRIPVVAKALQVAEAWDIALDYAVLQIDEAIRTHTSILSPLDVGYPPLLASTKDDPMLIFVRGQLSLSLERAVAIIGTREPTPHGILIAQRISQFFVSENWSVVSGLAIGCDAISHQAVIDAGGHTVAVLAHGLHMVAPTRHRKLADDILASGGALVSEYPFGQGAMPQQFVKRDRTQAGLAHGVVMIQSDLKGGSLHASRAALDYHRWLAVPYPTELDLRKSEPKIQANLLIADGSVAARGDLLRCLSSTLDRVIVLRSKDDYTKMTSNPITVGRTSDPSQTSFM